MVVYPTHISGGSRTSRRRAPNRQNFLLGNFSKKKTTREIEDKLDRRGVGVER